MHDQVFAQAYPFARRAAAVRSAAATRMASLPSADRVDLEQEALVAVWRALPRYDPARASLRTFVEVVVASRLASLMRAHHRHPAPVQLEEYHQADGDQIPAIEFGMDFRFVSASLAELDRHLVAVLLDHSPTEASRALRVSRSTVYEGIHRIRATFANAGFGRRGWNSR